MCVHCILMRGWRGWKDVLTSVILPATHSARNPSVNRQTTYVTGMWRVSDCLECLWACGINAALCVLKPPLVYSANRQTFSLSQTPDYSHFPFHSVPVSREHSSRDLNGRRRSSQRQDPFVSLNLRHSLSSNCAARKKIHKEDTKQSWWMVDSL